MAKIARATQQQFGSTAAANQLAKFGSFAAGTPVRYSGSTVTPALIQALSNYLQGWFGAVDGVAAPAIEDMNSICYLFAYQLCYLFQQGIPEWDAATTYYKGSIVQDGSGVQYVSLIDNNLNHAVTVSADWQRNSAGVRTVTTNDAATASDDVIRCNNGSSAMTETLPAIAAVTTGKRLTIKRISTSTAVVTVASSDTIDGLTTFNLNDAGDAITVVSNGTSWDII